MLYKKGNHAKLKRVQPQPSPLQGENGGKKSSDVEFRLQLLGKRSIDFLYGIILFYSQPKIKLGSFKKN
jgi:hypothetical protein